MNEPSVNVGQELVSRLKALNDRLEAEVARLRLTDAERDDLRRPRTDNADLPICAGAGDTTEPFAWAIEVSEGVWSFTHMPHVAKRWPQEVFIPLYRQSQPTLTDAECDDLRVWLAECLRQASTATEGANEELAERWNERAKRAAAMIERQILNVRKLVDG